VKIFWTSYYAKARELPKGYVQVQISNRAPKTWHPVLRGCEELLMPESWRRRQRGEVVLDWRKDYWTQLTRLQQTGQLKEIVDRLPNNAVLLCYEADKHDCHRTVLAEFLEREGLAIAKEFEPPKRERVLV
jgi:uncharacterized protein YeaO (DUF488 family)